MVARAVRLWADGAGEVLAERRGRRDADGGSGGRRGRVGGAIRRLAARQDQEHRDRGDGDDHRDGDDDDPAGRVAAAGWRTRDGRTRGRTGGRWGRGCRGRRRGCERGRLPVSARAAPQPGQKLASSSLARPQDGQVLAMSSLQVGRSCRASYPLDAGRDRGIAVCVAGSRRGRSSLWPRSGCARRVVRGERSPHRAVPGEHEGGGGEGRRRPVGERRPRPHGAPQQRRRACWRRSSRGRWPCSTGRAPRRARPWGWRARSAPCSCPRWRRCRGRRRRRGPPASSRSRRRRSRA